MVITNGDFGWTVVRPTENDTPLVVDSYGMKARKFSPEGLEAVARRNGEILEDAGSIHLNELAQDDAVDGGKASTGFRVEEFFRFLVGEGLNHAMPVT